MKSSGADAGYGSSQNRFVMASKDPYNPDMYTAFGATLKPFDIISKQREDKQKDKMYYKSYQEVLDQIYLKEMARVGTGIDYSKDNPSVKDTSNEKDEYELLE